MFHAALTSRGASLRISRAAPIVHGYAWRWGNKVHPQSDTSKPALHVERGGFILPGDPNGPYGSDYEIKLYASPALPGLGTMRDLPSVGTTADGSLRFEQNEQGLYFEWRPGTDEPGRELYRQVAAWNRNGACIGFPRWRLSCKADEDGRTVEYIAQTYTSGLILPLLGCGPGTGCKAMTGPRIPGDPDLVGTKRTLADAKAAVHD